MLPEQLQEFVEAVAGRVRLVRLRADSMDSMRFCKSRRLRNAQRLSGFKEASNARMSSSKTTSSGTLDVAVLSLLFLGMRFWSYPIKQRTDHHCFLENCEVEFEKHTVITADRLHRHSPTGSSPSSR